MNDAAKDIEKGLRAFGNAIHEAGKKRNEEIIAKQGYLVFRKGEAAQLYQIEHPDWSCQFVDGEYRFFPPEIKKTDILETFKDLNSVSDDILLVSIGVLEGDETKCRYRLMVVDRKTGRKSVVQEEIVDFDGKFSKEILPSIYYALSNGMPVVEQEKGTERFSVRLSNVSQNRVLYLGNLTLDRLRLVHEMKSFVDKKMGLDIPSNENLTI